MGVHGWRLISLIGAALLGGYLLATAASIFLSHLLPVPRSEATMVGHLLGFAFYTGAIIWVFHLRKPGRAWLSLILASALLYAASLVMQG